MKALGRVGRTATRGRGALVLLGAMFAISGVLRIWDGAAIAEDRAPQSTALAQPVCEAPEGGVAAALDAVRAREARLAAREAALLDRLRALEVAEKTVTAKLTDLTEAERRLADTMARSDRAAEEDLVRLTSVYENMKPKQAAVLFTRMEPDFAAGFLGRMRPDAAAAILSGLEPDNAYAISVLMAGRNAGAPTE